MPGCSISPAQRCLSGQGALPPRPPLLSLATATDLTPTICQQVCFLVLLLLQQTARGCRTGTRLVPQQVQFCTPCRCLSSFPAFLFTPLALPFLCPNKQPSLINFSPLVIHLNPNLLFLITLPR